MARLRITNHAVDRYRERTTKDTLRKDKTDKRIREIIKNAVIAHEKWEHLEELIKIGTKPEIELKVRIFDDWDFIATHKAILTPSNKGRSFTVTTFV